MVGIENPAVMDEKGLDAPYWLHQPVCRTLFQMDRESTAASQNNLFGVKSNYGSLLSKAGSVEAAKEIISVALMEKLSKVLSIPIEDIDGHISISSYGTDSLVAVELRNWLSKDIGSEVTTLEISGNVGIDDFSGVIPERSGLVVHVAHKG